MIVVVILAYPYASEGASLRGSRASVDLQARVAKEHDLTLLRDEAHVRRFVAAKLLVPVKASAPHLRLHGPSYPFARPAVKLFLERLSRQFHAACGETLFVTGLTRPICERPPNGSKKSVHFAGMAVDLRIPKTEKCRTWIEETLLELEKLGVIEATREYRPPHFHVAVFPSQYAAHVKARKKRKAK